MLIDIPIKINYTTNIITTYYTKCVLKLNVWGIMKCVDLCGELLGDFRFEYEYEIEYENDFSILLCRLHIITIHTHFIP